MRKNSFELKDGEVQLELHRDGSSILYKSERDKIFKISEYIAEELIH